MLKKLDLCETRSFEVWIKKLDLLPPEAFYEANIYVTTGKSVLKAANAPNGASAHIGIKKNDFLPPEAVYEANINILIIIIIIYLVLFIISYN